MMMMMTIIQLLVPLSLVVIICGHQASCEKSENRESAASKALWAGECGQVPFWDPERLRAISATQIALTGNPYIGQMVKKISDAFSNSTPSYVTVATRFYPDLMGPYASCGGVVLNNRQVLTTAQCVRDMRRLGYQQNSSTIKVFAGTIRDVKLIGFGIEVMSVCTPRRFQASTNIVVHDVAVLQLQWFVPETVDYSRACLLKPNELGTLSGKNLSLMLVRPAELEPGSYIPQTKFDKLNKVTCPEGKTHKTSFCASIDIETTIKLNPFGKSLSCSNRYHLIKVVSQLIISFLCPFLPTNSAHRRASTDGRCWQSQATLLRGRSPFRDNRR